MLKNQQGITLLETLVITVIMLIFSAMILYMGISVGRREAMGIPLQFKELERISGNNKIHIADTKILSRNFAVILIEGDKIAKERIVANLPKRLKKGDVFIIINDDVAIIGQ